MGYLATRLETNMNTPPNGQYEKPYNGETVLTADRQPIVDGLRVFTNNLDRGRISLARANFEWHGVERRYVLWFDVVVDTDYKGNPVDGKRCLQSDDRVATRFEGKKA
jgi:hypothetical protein